MDVSPIPESDVRAELERILSSRGFASAGRLSRLLRYVVEKTIAGESDQLKEYAVGVEVFERDEKYDPRLDSIVRVEAGRVRAKLEAYYNGPGRDDPVVVRMEKGGYSPVFERRAAATPGSAAPVNDAAQPIPATPPPTGSSTC